MRCLLSIIFAALLASPALADSYCRMNGPYNCDQQIDAQLTAITKSAINTIHMTQDPHPFKTENDAVLAAAAREREQMIAITPTPEAATWTSQKMF